MKIAFVIREFPQISETPILDQINGLIDLGHQVDIISFRHGNTKVTHPDVGKYRLLDRTTFLWDKWSNSLDRAVKAPLFLFRLFFLLPFMMRTGRYDIIHCQSGRQGLKLMLFRKLHLLGGKLIVQLRGHDISEVVKLGGKDYYKPLFQQADYFLPVCEYFRRRAILLGCPKNKITVMRLGIDLKRFRFSIKKKPVKGSVKLVFVGRLVEKKGVEYAIQALSILKKANYDVELDIVGDGILKSGLQQLCRSLGMGKYVNFSGERNRTQVIEILKKSHLLVAPSVTSKTGDQEGIPSVIKEAMASGLPVVSTYHSGIPELVKNGISGFLVREGDVGALAERVAYLIDHPKLWFKMGKAGRRFVEEYYNHEILNRQLADLCHRLIV